MTRSLTLALLLGMAPLTGCYDLAGTSEASTDATAEAPDGEGERRSDDAPDEDEEGDDDAEDGDEHDEDDERDEDEEWDEDEGWDEDGEWEDDECELLLDECLDDGGSERECVEQAEACWEEHEAEHAEAECFELLEFCLDTGVSEATCDQALHECLDAIDCDDEATDDEHDADPDRTAP